MKKSRDSVRMLAAAVVLESILITCFPLPSLAEDLYAPQLLLQRKIAEKSGPEAIANTFLQIPYRDDGTIDSNGNFTTFNDPNRILETPGLNCSGLVLSISRYLFHRNFTLDEVRRDRRGDSGPESPLGQDWDFGWDLIVNLTEKITRRVVLPGTVSAKLEEHDARSLRGFDLHDESAWRNVIGKMMPGRVYFGTISRDTGPGRRGVLHYHVALIIPNEKGEAWLYHSTRRSRVHRMDLNGAEGLTRLWAQFGQRGRRDKKILIVEALLPDAAQKAAAEQNKPDTQARHSPANAEGKDQRVARALEILDNIGVKAEEPRKSASPASDPKETPGAEVPVQSSDRPQSDDAATASKPQPPTVVINHVVGRVFNKFPDLVTQMPSFADEQRAALKLWYQNRGDRPRDLELRFTGPQGDLNYKSKLPPNARDVTVIYPKDFPKATGTTLTKGKYRVEASVDGQPWLVDVFEVDARKDASPKIIGFRAPSRVRSGETFTVEVTAENQGEESDYGGITMSTPDPSALRLVSATPGRIYGPGSTVLSITQDKIKIKVPMAEQWIELWAQKKSYNMKVGIKAGKPGVYPLYVRVALRSVEIKSSVILMDPQSGDTIDQQSFPVYVHQITVE